MAKKVKSAKGVRVDFDLLKIKQQLSDTSVPTEVDARRDFIDRRLRRRIKRVPAPAPKVQADDPVSPTMPETEELSVETNMIDEKKTKPKVTRSRQKTRPPKKDNNTDNKTGE